LQGTQRFSFTDATAPSGWVAARGTTFASNGNYGWVPADGQDRQCGTRNNNPDPVLDAFCHANTRYAQINGTWNAIASPATWKTGLANGTYNVTVTVGDARYNFADIAHSVQAEGITVHDRVQTTNTNPFKTNTVTVTITDGSLDLTFTGGTKTKIVSVEIAPASSAAGFLSLGATTDRRAN